MSFFQDFKNELSQAVNELVNMDETDIELSGEAEADEDNEDMARRRTAKKAETRNRNEFEEQMEYADMESTILGEEPEDEITVKEETINTMDGNLEQNGLDIQLLNELFGSDDDESILEDSLKLEPIQESFEIERKPADDQIAKKEQARAALRGEQMHFSNTERNPQPERIVEETVLAAEEVSEISKGTVIEGSIASEGSVTIQGKVNGNVSCRGTMVIGGEVNGTVRATEVITSHAKVNGDITSNGSVKIGNGSVIIGNVYGTSAVIAGAIQGDVDIHGPVEIDGTAVIQGNIRSRSVQINNGAAIEGMISQCYAEIDYTALFDKTFNH